MFPLPLSSFEWMMVLEDRPHYPMIAGVELTFSGRLTQPAWDHAFAAALERHPLLRAKIETSFWKGPRWVLTDCPKITWGTASDSLPAEFSHGIDLYQEAGLRCFVQNDVVRPKLHLQIHHACCDGTGIFQFVEDLLVGYRNQTQPAIPPLPLSPLEPKRLPQRSHFPLNSANVRQWLYHCWFGVREAIKFTARLPQPLAASAVPPEVTVGEAPFPVLIKVGDKTFLIKLRTAAAKLRATLNDVLMRDVLVTAREWNESHGKLGAEDILRILMPCDLRKPTEVATPAANIMSYSFLTRFARDCTTLPQFLRDIQTETEFIRDRNASLYFIRSLEVSRRIPGSIHGMAKSPNCFSTMLLSNVGDPTRRFAAPFERQEGKLVVGDVCLEQISAYPPLRPLTRAGLVVCTYPDQLSLGLRYDDQTLTREDGSEFLNRFFQQLEITATAN